MSAFGRLGMRRLQCRTMKRCRRSHFVALFIPLLQCLRTSKIHMPHVIKWLLLYAAQSVSSCFFHDTLGRRCLSLEELSSKDVEPKLHADLQAIQISFALVYFSRRRFMSAFGRLGMRRLQCRTMKRCRRSHVMEHVVALFIPLRPLYKDRLV